MTCVACGRSRSPFSAVPVNVAGQPSRIGGTIAGVFGWFVLAGGLAAAAFFTAILQWLIPAGFLGWVVGGVMLFLALAVSVPLLLGASAMRRSGARSKRDAAETAVRALASHKGGVVTAAEVGQAIGVPEAEADAVLTELAKQGGDVRLEIDDDGRLYYTVGRARVPPEHVRIAARVGGAGDATAEQEDAALDEADSASARRKR